MSQQAIVILLNKLFFTDACLVCAIITYSKDWKQGKNTPPGVGGGLHSKMRDARRKF